MADVKKSPTTQTKSEESPTKSVPVVNGSKEDNPSIEVKIGVDGETKVAVEVNKIEARSKQDGAETEKPNEPDVEPITDEEVEEIVSKYAKMDKDDLKTYMDFFWSVDTYHFGAFTVHQLAYRLHLMGHRLTNKEIVKMFSDLDTNNDLLVSLDEYLIEMSKPKPKTNSKEDMKIWFDRFDCDRDGFVNRNDIRDAMDERGFIILSPQIDELLRNDSSGRCEKLNFNDFCVAVARMK